MTVGYIVFIHMYSSEIHTNGYGNKKNYSSKTPTKNPRLLRFGIQIICFYMTMADIHRGQKAREGERKIRGMESGARELPRKSCPRHIKARALARCGIASFNTEDKESERGRERRENGI